MKSFISSTFFIVQIGYVVGQINLGTLNLNRNQNGDLEFGLGQAANVSHFEFNLFLYIF